PLRGDPPTRAPRSRPRRGWRALPQVGPGARARPCLSALALGRHAPAREALGLLPPTPSHRPSHRARLRTSRCSDSLTLSSAPRTPGSAYGLLYWLVVLRPLFMLRDAFGQRDREGCAFALGAVKADRATVAFDDCLRDR